MLCVMRKWIHRALKGASLTTALFVFQACYGTPPGLDYDILEQNNETELVEENVAEEEPVVEETEQIVAE
jgi:hypothetical protein